MIDQSINGIQHVLLEPIVDIPNELNSLNLVPIVPILLVLMNLNNNLK